jgi:F-type H+-transporting ATPase subunit b
MSSPLLLLAQVSDATAAAPGGLMSGVTRITNEFGIRAPLLLAQIVNFTVVAFLLWKFAFKPVMATIEERQKKIDAGLNYAEEMKAKLEAAQQASQAQIKEAQITGQKIVAEAQKAAKDLSERQQKEAVVKAGELIAKAREAIELEKKLMLAEARTEIARLVVSTTQKVLARELSESDRGRFNESAARELTQV